MSLHLKCSDCKPPKYYRFKKQLEAHIAEVHLNYFPYKCLKCTDVFLPTDYALAKHYTEVHDIVRDIPFEECYKFGYASVQQELDDKVKKCMEDYKNNSPKYWEEEIDCIKLSTPVECQCEGPTVTLNTVQSLEEHIARVHYKSFPYKCEICESERFPTEYTLKQHYFKKHKTSHFTIMLEHSPGTARILKSIAESMVAMQKTRVPGPSVGTSGFRPHAVKRLRRDIPEESPGTSTEGDVEFYDGRATIRAAPQPTSTARSQAPNPALSPTKHTAPPHRMGITPSPASSTVAPPAKSIATPQGKSRSIRKLPKVKAHVQNGEKEAHCKKCLKKIHWTLKWEEYKAKASHACHCHANLDLFECGHCGKKFNGISKGDLNKHIRSQHEGDDKPPGREACYNNKKRYEAEIAQSVKECFPTNN